jgi:hypothetical protein
MGSASLAVAPVRGDLPAPQRYDRNKRSFLPLFASTILTLDFVDKIPSANKMGK